MFISFDHHVGKIVAFIVEGALEGREKACKK
jgi:hypothetical protein